MNDDVRRVLLICGASDTVINFRRSFIKKLIAENVSVAVVAFDDKRKSEIEQLGVRFFSSNDSNRNANPLKIFDLKKKYMKIIKEVEPDVVFTFMLKPNTIGVQAAYKACVKNIYSMVEGAGDVFINNSLKWKIIRRGVCYLYRSAFKKVKKVFFLNQDDKKDFIERKLVDDNKAVVIPGIGVDTVHFAFKEAKNVDKFLMIARMLTTKGVLEYCNAARIVKQYKKDVTFGYIGAEGTLKISDIQEFIDDGTVNYIGTTKDVRPYLEDCAVFVLPSYREGMPMSIMEAESVGRAVITTDTNGCRDTVLDGYNGKIVQKGDVEGLASAMIWCLDNPDEIVKMGQNSRRFAEDKFEQGKINQQILEGIE